MTKVTLVETSGNTRRQLSPGKREICQRSSRIPFACASKAFATHGWRMHVVFSNAIFSGRAKTVISKTPNVTVCRNGNPNSNLSRGLLSPIVPIG